MFLCKSWNIPATEVYFQELYLSGDRLFNWSQFKSLLTRHRRKNMKLAKGHLVRTLTIHRDTTNCFGVYSDDEDQKEQDYQVEESDHSDDSDEDNQTEVEDDIFYQIKRLENDDFLYLLKCLSDLKVLDLRSCRHHQHYLSILLDADNDHLEGIESIRQSTHYKRFDRLHFLRCCKHRNTLTRLLVSYLNRTYTINGRSGNCLYFLSSFNNLTHLSIVRNDSENYTPFDFIQALPNLTSFQYPNVGDTMEPIDSNIIHHYSQKLKVFILWFLSLKEPYLSYITTYPVGILDTLEIGTSI